MIAFVQVMVLAGVVTAVPAPVHRVAVIVGADKAAAGRAPLRFSYDDARSVASVLEELGGFRPSDVVLLEDPEPQNVLATLDTQLAALGRDSGESVLVFYYSGHADEQALYPNGEPLPYTELRRRLESPAATVRLGIIDACGGGGWTQAKGLHPEEPFPVEGSLALTTEGSMLIASSSGVESAREAENIRGSFFTHHFVAGLRGAASHGDRRVTATEAFAYARELTIRDSALSGGSPQHPSFAMNLHGRDDLPLTQLADAGSTVLLKQIEGPLQLINLDSGLILMEAPAGRRALWMAVPPGHYLVRRQTSDGIFARDVSVDAGQTVSVDEASLQLVGSLELALKGPVEEARMSDTFVPARPWHRFEVAVGLGGGVPWPGLQTTISGSGWSTPIDVIWGVTDRVNLSILSPAVGVLLGRPRDLEVAMGAGVLSWQSNDFVESIAANLGVRAMLRKWFNERRALNVGLRVSTQLTIPTGPFDVTVPGVWNTMAYVGVSLFLGERWTFNLGVQASVNLTDGGGILPLRNDAAHALSLGIGAVEAAGVRPLPAVELRINDHWSLYGDVFLGWNFGANTETTGVVGGTRFLF